MLCIASATIFCHRFFALRSLARNDRLVRFQSRLYIGRLQATLPEPCCEIMDSVRMCGQTVADRRNLLCITLVSDTIKHWHAVLVQDCAQAFLCAKRLLKRNETTKCLV